MKNHWLKKKEDKTTTEDIRLARELETEGVESVCEWNEIADVEPITCNEITIGNGWSGLPEMKIEDITCTTTSFDFCGQPLCISGIASPPIDPAISSITISNDWAGFEPGQTALAELDMEIGNGSIKHTRETTIGSFIFKDAGELGVDIFQNGIKVGWLNNQGEKALKQWLNDKPVAPVANPPVNPWLDVNAWAKRNFDTKPKDNSKKEVRSTLDMQIVSNEYVKGRGNVFQLENANIIPGSVLFTAYVNNVPVQNECLMEDDRLTERYYGSIGDKRGAVAEPIKGVIMNFTTGTITVDWEQNPENNYHLSVCYEYRKYEESKLKERWTTIC